MNRLNLPEKVTVNSQEGDRFRVTRYEAFILISALAVEAHVRPNNHENVYLRLRVPRQRYFQLLKGVRSPASPRGVTRAKQTRGNKHWIVRLDNAQCGVMGKVAQMSTAVFSEEEYRERSRKVSLIERSSEQFEKANLNDFGKANLDSSVEAALIP